MPRAPASLGLIAALLFSWNAHAFVRTISETGLPLFWVNPSLVVRANPGNASGLDEQQVSDLLSGAFASWSVPGSRATATYLQSPSFPANSNFDGSNAVYFASQAGRTIDYGVVALTEVLYYVASGQIAETDMVFNDRHFVFTANEGDTGKGAGGGKVAIYLQDVATHEAGHAFGLDHSIVNLSSLVYTAFSGQFVLNNDDKSAIRTVYPSTGGRSALTGRVSGLNGGIFGTHVAAIHLDSGKVESAALANPDGSFRIGDLPAGRYAVMMEPFGADITSISGYFRNVSHRFCGGYQEFRRRFYGPCGTNQVAVVEVGSGEAKGLGTLSPSCTQMGNPGGSPSSPAAAQSFPSGGGARFGTLRPGEIHYYRLEGVSGDLVARAISYSLYSPVDVNVELLDPAGGALPGATSTDNIADPMPGGKINYDSLAEATVAPGNYLLKVSASDRRLYSSYFPAGFDLLDGDGHYLLTLSVNGSHGTPFLSDMSACVTVNNRPQSASARAPASREDRESTTGCGSLGSAGTPPWNGGLLQFLAAAGLFQLFLLLSRKAALVRKRR